MKTNENIEKLYKSELRDFESDMLSESKMKSMWEEVSNKIEAPRFSTDNHTNNVNHVFKSGSKARFFAKSNIMVIASTSILTLAVAFFISQNVTSTPEQQPVNHTSTIPVSSEVRENVYEEVKDEEAEILHESVNEAVSNAIPTSGDKLNKENIVPQQNNETVKINPAKDIKDLHGKMDDAGNDHIAKSSSTIKGAQSKSTQVVITKEVKDTIQRVEKLRVDPRKYKGKKK